MKKIAGILLLTAAVILTAGCISSADPVLGTWELVEPLPYNDGTVTYNLTFAEDGTGLNYYSFSDQDEVYFYPIFWKSIGDNTYEYEEVILFTISSDEKTMTDIYDREYTLKDGVWVQNIVEDDGYATYEFAEDGFGLEKYYLEGELEETSDFVWEYIADRQIQIRYITGYTFLEDGTMTTEFGKKTGVFENVDGIWVETPQLGDTLTTYEFRDDGMCVRTIYNEYPNDVKTIYDYCYVENSDGTGGILQDVYLYTVVLQDDGTLKDTEYGDILVRV